MAAPEGPFDRDLSYLARFLDKLGEHAAALGGDVGTTLGTLIDEEKGRWERIAALLVGEAREPEEGSAAEVPLSEAHESTDVTIAVDHPPTDPGLATPGGTIVEMPAAGRAQAPLPPSTRAPGSPVPGRTNWTVGSLVDGPRKR